MQITRPSPQWFWSISSISDAAQSGETLLHSLCLTAGSPPHIPRWGHVVPMQPLSHASIILRVLFPLPGMTPPTSSWIMFQDLTQDSLPLTYSKEVNPSFGPPLCLVQTFITYVIQSWDSLNVRHPCLGIKDMASRPSSAPLPAVLVHLSY